MAGNYTVVQGDHLSKIAKMFGFTDYHTIWDDPNNANLKQQRQNPNVLYPGDVLYIPDRELREEARPTEQQHHFKLQKPPLKLRLILQDIYEQPIANTKCLLNLGTNSLNVTTDSTGKIEQAIPADVRDAQLVIQDDQQTAFANTLIAVEIGDLDPVDQLSGQIARLNNLGYFAGDPSNPQAASDPSGCGCNGTNTGTDTDSSSGTDSSTAAGSDSSSGTGSTGGQTPYQQTPYQKFRSAVEEFQCDNNLTVDGICGPATQATLLKVHGC